MSRSKTAKGPQGPILLCADTATLTASVAVLVGGEVRAERAARAVKGHGPGLLDQIVGALEDAEVELSQVDALICGLGPGTFTGLRIALATLKGLALAQRIPLYGARTTLALALPGVPTLAMLDARRSQVFVDGPWLDGPMCLAPADLPQHIPADAPILMLGDGARAYRSQLKTLFPQASIPTDPALHMVRAARLVQHVDLSQPAPNLATLEPVYIRKSDAEINYPDGFPAALAGL